MVHIRNRIHGPLVAIGLGVALLASGNGLAAESAGRVLMALGTVEAERAQARHPLARRSEVLRQDVVTTAAASRTQIRFIDNAVFTLDAGSRLDILDYRYRDPGGKPDRAHMRLLQGSLRTVTGAIGSAQAGAWQVETPLASIGVRGTEGRIGHLRPGAGSAPGVFNLDPIMQRFAGVIGNEPFSLVIVDQGVMTVRASDVEVAIRAGGLNGALVLPGRAPMVFATDAGGDPVNSYALNPVGHINDAPTSEAGRPRDGDSGFIVRIQP